MNIKLLKDLNKSYEDAIFDLGHIAHAIKKGDLSEIQNLFGSFRELRYGMDPMFYKDDERSK